MRASKDDNESMPTPFEAYASLRRLRVTPEQSVYKSGTMFGAASMLNAAANSARV